MEFKKVGILGLGALGILYGEKLSRVLGKDLYILVDGKRKERYIKEGVFSNGEKLDFNYLDYETEEADLDLIIVALKAYHLKETLPKIQKSVKDRTVFISLMNGVDSEEIIGEMYGEEKILYTVAQGMDATREGRNLYFKNSGNISVGEKDRSQSERLKALTDLFDKSGIEWNKPDDIIHQMWSKLMLNSGINQVLALYNGTYEDFHKDPEIRQYTLDIMEEVRQIALAKGINITKEDLHKWEGILDSLDPKMKPSMAQDMEAGRRTEVDTFSGKVCRLGKELGIETPLNEKMIEDLMKKEEKNEHKK